MNVTQSAPESTPCSIAVVVARFNRPVTDQLLAGCEAALRGAGLGDEDWDVVQVPGAWELPLAARWLIDCGRYRAIIALGAVIRGQTAHFDFISAQCARGLQQIQLDSAIPVVFGVLTTETGAQAEERADPGRLNKGREVALAALAMLELADRLNDDR